jgi:putative hydrolase of the HAD superfamily
MSHTAVLFDLGGVVLGSPLQAIRDYEADLGLARNAINRVAAETAPTGAWSRLERGELEMDAFYPAFEADCREAGLEIDARRMMQRMTAASGPRPEMLAAIARLRENAFRVGALTNNWTHTEAHTEARSEASGHDETRAIKAHFDVFIESSVEGLRKPDPAIYRIACERLETPPEAIVFLDDIGHNLKPARAMGMATIKVEDPGPALDELARIVGLDLLRGM